MLPLLVTLPGPGSTPSKEVLHVAAEAIADPTTAALPESTEAHAPIEATRVAPDGEVEAEPADRPAGPDLSPSTDTVASPSVPQDALEPAKAEVVKDESAKDQGPLQGAGPESTPPTEATEETFPKADANNITSAAPEVKEAAATRQPEVVVATSPALSETQSASDERHAPNEQPDEPPAPEVIKTPAPELQPEPEVARAEPAAETKLQEPPAKIPAAEAAPETSAPVTPKVEDAAPSKVAPNLEAAPHNKPAPRVRARAKAAPAAVKRHPVATTKQGAPPLRRSVKARVRTPAKQVVVLLFRGIFGATGQ